MKGQWRKRRRKILEFIEDAVFIISIVTVCMMLYSIKVHGYVAIGNYRFFRIVSNSMEPTLYPNTCVIEEVVTSHSQLKVGDIITFVSHEEQIYGELNTHRIVGIKTNSVTGEIEYRTKGDFFSVPDDQRVRLSDIKGKYVRNIPGSQLISFIVIRLSNSWVYFFVIMVPLIYCLLTYIYKLIYLLMIGDEGEEEKS